MNIQLIVGLGNPGPEYAKTRHNAGFWFVDRLAENEGGLWKPEAKFLGHVAKITIAQQPIWLLKPTTFMNRSGQAVSQLAAFYKIEPEQILVVHDELDLPVGHARIKRGGSAAGHNGLKDIIRHLPRPDFLRLRLGIDHPGQRMPVADYVLRSPPAAERELIEAAICDSLRYLPSIVRGELDSVMQTLHARKS